MNPYETDGLLRQYLIFHYADEEAQFPYPFGGSDGLGFPRRCVSEGIDPSVLSDGSRGLDLGCGVGRSSFELARYCGEVVGIDYSQSFIDAALRLKEDGAHAVVRRDEGSATTRLSVSVSSDIDRLRVSFERGDAGNIRSDIGCFDVVMACNLICRLPDPMELLLRLPDLVKSGGQLFITTPFSWLKTYTRPENWLGDGGHDSFSALRMALEPHFELNGDWNMPFLIREHARNFQYGVARASRWIRK